MYLQTMTTLLSENKNPQHQEHIIQFTLMCKEMIEELVPQIVEKTLETNYLDLWLKLRMVLEGKEVYFNDVANYVEKEITNILKNKLK